MQTVTLTINVPDDVASRFHALPADTFNRFTVAALPGLIDALDAAETAQTEFDAGEEADEEEWPGDIYLTHPLPASLTQPVGEMLRKSHEAAEAGRVIDGETFLANIRKRAGRE